MDVEVRLYGRLAELAGTRRVVANVSGPATVAEVRRRLGEVMPPLAAALANSGTRACIADLIVGEDRTVAGDETVEFLPVVSGG